METRRQRPVMWALAAIAALSGTHTASGQCATSFGTPVTYATGANPIFVTSGDLNRDGIIDLVTANLGSANVSVMLGTGYGTFGAAVNYATGVNARGVAVADLNRDGTPDLAVANQGPSNVSVLIGNGAGGFAAAVNYAAAGGALSVAAGDYNGDGIPDLVTANESANSFSFLSGTGTGTFNAAVNTAVGSSPKAVAPHDFNRDGKLDLAVVCEVTARIEIRSGNGNGTFGAATQLVTGPNPFAAAVGDLNRDGKADIAVAHSNSLASTGVFLGNGDGTFAAMTSLGGLTSQRGIAVADMNIDGSPDLLTANYQGNNVSVYNGNGDGTFDPATHFSPCNNNRSVVVADFNADGRPDMATSNFNGQNVSVFLNTSPALAITQQPADAMITAGQNATFNVTATGATAYQWRRNGAPLTNTLPYSGVTTATLTITGATATEAGTFDVQVIGGCSNGTFSRAAALCVKTVAPSCPASMAAAVNYGAGSNTQQLATGDLNGDGHFDLVMANSGSNNVTVRLGIGDGSFAAGVNYSANASPYAVALGDLNEDGRLDLAVSHTSSVNVQIRLGNGDGTFAAAVNYSAESSLVRDPVLADFNGDGHLDLAVVSAAAISLRVRLGAGDGTFGAEADYTVGSSANSLAAADLNSDGALDLAVSRGGAGGTGGVDILIGNGDGTFQPRVNTGAGGGAATTLADVNGDGAHDLVTLNQTSLAIYIQRGVGDGTFLAPLTLAAPGVANPSWYVAVGDLNGDRIPDLAYPQSTTDTLSVLIGNGDATYQPAVTYAVGTNPKHAAVTDFNGDGRMDLIATNTSSSDVSVLLNNGASIGISPQPVSQTVMLGASVSFTATAVGTGPFTYQWRRDGVPITGATDAVLNIAGVTANDVAAYDVQIRGGCNPAAVATSRPATLSLTVCKGDFNDDTLFDGDDLQDLINALLTGQTCPM